MDNIDKGQEFIERYLAGTASEEERVLVERFYLEQFKEHAFPERVKDAAELKGLMWKYISAEAGLKVARPTYPLWKKMAGIAAAAAAITLGTWLYFTLRHPEGSAATRDLLVNDIKPGRNTATLTLASGEVINLDTNRTGVIINVSQLTYSDGTAIASSLRDEVKQSQLVIASTPRGGTYQITLPDGTKAWLNAASSIKFPSNFAGTKQRRIEITGEVYLEVAKDKKYPFIVESAGQQVEVLGTHFNINSYPDEGITKTTLLEGSVKVSAWRGSSLSSRAIAKDLGAAALGTQTTALGTTTLKPGQQSLLTDNQIKVEQANLTEAIAWKDGYFRFYDEDLASIMRKLEKWYDIEVTLSESLGKKEFTGKITRNKNISTVLKMLEKTNSVYFKIEGRRVVAIE